MDQTDIHPTGELLVQEICKTMSDLKLVKEWVTKSKKKFLFVCLFCGIDRFYTKHLKILNLILKAMMNLGNN